MLVLTVSRRFLQVSSFLIAILGSSPAFAGVSRAIQDRYRQGYENKALFLKIPIFSEKAYLYITGKTLRQDLGGGNATARFKVGDQVRILGLDFAGDEIRFKLGAIKGIGSAELVFKFDANLQETFPNSDDFESALSSTFTEGLKFSDIEEAKKAYIEDQFERGVRDLANITTTSREFVIRNMAPRIPAYQDALRDLDNLKNRNQDLSSQLVQLQTENRKLETDVRQHQADGSRLRNQTTSLQEKIDNSTSQLSRLTDDLRSARGLTQNYQSQIQNLQRSLNIKVDDRRDLAAQIGEIAQAMRKLRGENENLDGQVTSLRSSLEETKSVNNKLTLELEDSNSSNRRLKETIGALTSKEDSLARQYLQLKQSKESLETVTNSIDSLVLRMEEDRTEDGYHVCRVRLFVRTIPVGKLEWRLPERLGLNEEKPGEFRITTESIDYVRVTPEERSILRSFGERLKLRVKLAPGNPSLTVTPLKDLAVQEIGERDQASWRWKIVNRGAEDARLNLAVFLVNKNRDEVPVLKAEQPIAAYSVVRQIRNYLQPIPMIVGGLLGFLLFGIVSVFRKPRKPAFSGKRPPLQPADAQPIHGPKRL